MNDSKITLYGSDWCGYTQRAVRQMDSLDIAYQYVDVDADEDAEALIASWNDGRAIRPTFDIGGAHFVNPSAAQLENELRTRGLLK